MINGTQKQSNISTLNYLPFFSSFLHSFFLFLPTSMAAKATVIVNYMCYTVHATNFTILCVCVSNTIYYRISACVSAFIDIVQFTVHFFFVKFRGINVIRNRHGVKHFSPVFFR